MGRVRKSGTGLGRKVITSQESVFKPRLQQERFFACDGVVIFFKLSGRGHMHAAKIACVAGIATL